VRAEKSIYEEVPALPDLFPGACIRRPDSRGDEGELVSFAERGRAERMTMTDPIADMLTRIRNANAAMHPCLDVPASKLKREILRVLKEEKYIENYTYIEDKKQGMLRVYLRYTPERERIITGIRRISSPGLRKYVRADEIPEVVGGLGETILSTPKGILSGRKAREQGVGGELLCTVW
jgi:small subunit ribosomal protein S8